jgi:hypothetical protein
MNTLPDLEALLRKAPHPEPPEELFTMLQKQIHLPAPPQVKPRTTLPQLWRRFWLPMTGLASAMVIAVIFLTFMSASSSRSLADTLRLLNTVKSFHLVYKLRNGPAQPASGGGTTPNHPDNPFEISEFWFQQDSDLPLHARMRTISRQQDVWREDNRVLTIDRQTGARSFQLNNSRFDFAGQGFWNLSSLAETWKLHEVSASKMPGASPRMAQDFWFAECRAPEQKMIYRMWMARTNQLPARIQSWSTAFPQIASEVLLQECEFSDFNATFPDQTFAFEITSEDLASLGLTRAELDGLSEKAMSIQLVGAAGTEIVGTLADDAGTRQIKGNLPFTIVHEQHGKLSFDFRTANGFPSKFGVRVKNMGPLSTSRTSHIRGWTSTNWSGRIEAVD